MQGSSLVPRAGRARAATGTTPAMPPEAARIVRVLAAVTLVVVALVLAGWASDTMALANVLPGMVAMKVNTAVCLGLLAVVCLTPGDLDPWLPRLVLGLVAAVALASLAEYAADLSLGIDELLAADPDGTIAPGRMSGTTAVCLLLLSLSLAVPTRRVLSQVASVAANVVAFVALLGYLYGVEDLYQVGPFETIALHTAILILMLGASAQLRVPDGLLSWVVAGTDAGALLLRRVVPVLLVALPLIGLVRLIGERHGYFGTPFGLALHVAASVGVITLTMLVVARQVQRLDQRRQSAADDVVDLNRNLEERVSSGAAELERRHTQLALRNDRDRIARDLHDLVIQRLFASGLQLASVQRLLGRGDRPVEEVQAMTGRLEQVIDELNEVSADLRSSIFSLTIMARSDDAVGAARAAVEHQGRSLTFEPALRVDLALNELPTELVDQVVAVLREGVSNVARHAHASAASVDVAVEEGVLVVTVQDDGGGMPASPVRSSGVANLRQRALRLGGEVRWEAVEPTGTRLVWRVPATPETVDG